MAIILVPLIFLAIGAIFGALGYIIMTLAMIFNGEFYKAWIRVCIPINIAVFIIIMLFWFGFWLAIVMTGFGNSEHRFGLSKVISYTFSSFSNFFITLAILAVVAAVAGICYRAFAWRFIGYYNHLMTKVESISSQKFLYFITPLRPSIKEILRAFIFLVLIAIIDTILSAIL